MNQVVTPKIHKVGSTITIRGLKFIVISQAIMDNCYHEGMPMYLTKIERKVETV